MPTTEFYIILALASHELHRYALKGEVYKLSYGSIDLDPAKQYPLISTMHERGLIDLVDVRQVGASDVPRKIYTISRFGAIRLQVELIRLNHAVEVAKRSGLFKNKTPTDIQRLLLETGIELPPRTEVI